MTNNQPTCYGKLWDPNTVECRGGLDPSYEHPKTGSSKREMCRWYQACGATQAHSRLHEAARAAPPPPPQVAPPPMTNAMGQLLPPQALVRAPAPTGIIPHAPQVPQAPQALVVHGAPPQQQVAHLGAVAYTQPLYANYPTMVPMNQPMPGAATQSFLMVPEPEDPNVPWSVQLWRNTYRALGKAVMMTVANFLDYNTIGPRPGK